MLEKNSSSEWAKIYRQKRNEGNTFYNELLSFLSMVENPCVHDSQVNFFHRAPTENLFSSCNLPFVIFLIIFYLYNIGLSYSSDHLGLLVCHF